MPRKAKRHSSLDQDTDASPSLDSSNDVHCLCLICRQTGHIVQSCPQFTQVDRHDSKTPAKVDPAPFSTTPVAAGMSGQLICERCKPFKGFAALSPFTHHDKVQFASKRAKRKTSQIPLLGPIKSLRLLSTCPLCRLIFEITHLNEDDIRAVVRSKDLSEGQLALVPAWTIHRLERDLDWPGCDSGKGPYAKCVYTSVTSKAAHKATELVDSAVDAIGAVDTRKNGVKGNPALGVKKVDRQMPNYTMIKEWLHRCGELHHITCRPLVSKGHREIKLVDVETRQIVKYPSGACDYIALSYVWGGVEQPSYKLGDVLPSESVPGTLEDAMAVTRNLGKRYLWADSLCIDQANDAEKGVQIALMSAIYSGAWATIFCISGQSAESRLPRVGTLEGVIPQPSCEIGDIQLFTMMPTLSQQLSWSTWTTRAWTFQEGMLSPRRLFFTNHQVYFECNSMQCCESLDASDSPFHLLSDEQRRKSIEEPPLPPGPEWVLGRGVLRDPFRPISASYEPPTNGPWDRYQNLLHSYTTRKMSQDIDSINAFTGMLTRLTETDYTKGFVYGLPLEELPRALLWTHAVQPRRRVDFPAWSWAGWEGVVRTAVAPGARYFVQAEMPPLRVWKAGEGQPELIYDFNPIPWIRKTIKDSESGTEWYKNSPFYQPYDEKKAVENPIFLMAKTTFQESPATAPQTIDRHELLIEGIVIQMTFSNQSWVETVLEKERMSDGIRSKRCLVKLDGESELQKMRLYSHNAAELIEERQGKEQEFLLLSSHSTSLSWFPSGRVDYALMIIDRDRDTVSKVGVANLILEDCRLLAAARPEKRLLRLK